MTIRKFKTSEIVHAAKIGAAAEVISAVLLLKELKPNSTLMDLYCAALAFLESELKRKEDDN